MKLAAAALLSLMATTVAAHGDHDHDTGPTTPPPPKVGAKVETPKAGPVASPSGKSAAEPEAEAGKPGPQKP